MRFRLEVNGIDYNTVCLTVLKKVEDLHYSRLPVYRKSLDEIVGILNTKDLAAIFERRDFDWHNLIRPTICS